LRFDDVRKSIKFTLETIVEPGRRARSGAVIAGDVFVAEGRDLIAGAFGRVRGVSGKSVECGDAAQRPPIVRLVEGVAGALVLEVDRRPQRPLDTRQQVGTASPVQGRRDTAAAVGKKVIGVTVAVDVRE